jgi:hypothetical protein
MYLLAEFQVACGVVPYLRDMAESQERKREEMYTCRSILIFLPSFRWRLCGHLRSGFDSLHLLLSRVLFIPSRLAASLCFTLRSSEGMVISLLGFALLRARGRGAAPSAPPGDATCRVPPLGKLEGEEKKMMRKKTHMCWIRNVGKDGGVFSFCDLERKNASE